MQNIMIVLDGVQDISYHSLGGNTPYDYGKGTFLRELEQSSVAGAFVTTPQGFEPDTQTGVITLLGVPPYRIPRGRSYLEAIAVGMPVQKDDLVLRCNFCQISPSGKMENPTCALPFQVADALSAEMQKVSGNKFLSVGSYKNLQCVTGGKRYLDSMVTYPPHNYVGYPLKQLLPRGNVLADELASVSRCMLQQYRPYTVFHWAPAARCYLPRFSDLHGISGAVVSATDVLVGAAAAMEMPCIRPDTATGDTDTDLAAKAEATLQLAQKYDFVLLHIGGTDEATHRKNACEKSEFVRRVDRELIGPLLAGCSADAHIMLTCDHVALCQTGGHTRNPVHFFLYHKGRHLSGDIGVLDGAKAVSILIENRL